MTDHPAIGQAREWYAAGAISQQAMEEIIEAATGGKLPGPPSKPVRERQPINWGNVFVWGFALTVMGLWHAAAALAVNGAKGTSIAGVLGVQLVLVLVDLIPLGIAADGTE